MRFPFGRAAQDAETLSDPGEHRPGAATSPVPEIRDPAGPAQVPDLLADEGSFMSDRPPPVWTPLPEISREAPLGNCLALRFTAGRLAPQVTEVGGPVVSVGRELDNDVQIPDAKVSRHHARLEYFEGAWVLTDLNSTNGIRLNGLPVTRAGLSSGDFLYLGETVIRVEPGTPAEPEPVVDSSGWDFNVGHAPN